MGPSLRILRHYRRRGRRRGCEGGSRKVGSGEEEAGVPKRVARRREGRSVHQEAEDEHVDGHENDCLDGRGVPVKGRRFYFF